MRVAEEVGASVEVCSDYWNHRQQKDPWNTDTLGLTVCSKLKAASKINTTPLALRLTTAPELGRPLIVSDAPINPLNQEPLFADSSFVCTDQIAPWGIIAEFRCKLVILSTGQFIEVVNLQGR